MKKILFILPSLTMGGLERTQVTLANALNRIGYGVTVMILDNNVELANELDESVRLVYKPYKNHPGKKIPYIRHKLYDDGMWETRATPGQLYKYYVGNEKFDVEIAYFHGLSVKIISGSTNREAVRLAWVHSDFKKIRSFGFNFKNFSDVQRAYKSFDKVFCVSEQAKKSFIEIIGDTGNTEVVYNMLPAEQIRRLAQEKLSFEYPASKLKLVLIGRLKDSVKGQKRLISAVSRLRAEGAEISLTLVGGGEDREDIEKEIKNRAASDYVYTAGSQKNPYPYIKKADLLVCASYYEGFNLTVAEALILGVPVLSTECTGPVEILDGGKYGIIVENSEEGLYEGLKKLYNSPVLLKDYREKAKLRQDFFSEEKILKQITDLF